MLRLTLAAVLCALTLSGCLPKSEFHASIQILDEGTGRPIPGAWVLPTAHVITAPPVDRFDVLAAERGRTGADGVARFTRVLGLYRPDAPQDPLWKAVDAKQAALRKPGHIAGGSIVVLAAGYGLIHQPFAVEDSPGFQNWLKDNPGRTEDYGGPLGRHAVKTNLKALLLKSAGFKDGVRLTLRLRKPTSARELAETESFRLARAMWGTWHALSRQTGATEREQRAIYEFCAAQMKAVADETRDPWHREMYEAYFNAEARRKYISENHGLGPDAQNGLIQAWLTQKALEILPQEAEEVKGYANEVLLGVLEEGRSPAWQNHFLDPKEPANGLPGSESALRWAGLDGDNPNNPWDWQDAQRYYREGDRRKAYLALGHVVRLLGNLAVPKYTVPDPAKETAFETAVLNVMGDNLGQLPPEYWHSAKDPAFARTPKERFEALARRTADSGASALEARGPGTGTLSPDMTDVAGSDSDLMAAKASFPNTIAQAAGLLRDFHRFMHPPAYVQAPGNGNGGPQAVRQSSGTDAGHATDAISGSEKAHIVKSDAGSLDSAPGGIRFLKGEVVFEDEFGKEIRRIKAGGPRGPAHVEITHIQKKDRTGRDIHINQRILRDATLAKSQRAVLITETAMEFAVAETTVEARLMEGTDAANLGATSALEVYGPRGNLMWRRQLNDKKSAMFPARISDDGRTVSVVEGCELNCQEFESSGPLSQLVVVNAAGEEVLRFPKVSGGCLVGTSGHWISRGGRYVITSCELPDGFPRSIVLDVTRRRIWHAPTLIDVLVRQTKSDGKIDIDATDQQLRHTKLELDFDKLPWEPLP